ncbi:Retrovirus-related Pol polyprotein from transposon opus [Vitis vinifera]|uniref:Retrovirus-related Pol polyprotein from transposon opus n=1 Tax=Vitis vinifera TaxID=29760 RepID=A0A438HS90_VITVI|nr:Retrovirus-related Pol polyprotein from transposon opus [Vitis vinifera]
MAAKWCPSGCEISQSSYTPAEILQDFLELPTLGKLLDSKETSISYLLRASEGKSKVNDHLEWQMLVDTSCVCQIGYETVEEGLLNINEGPMHPPRMSAPSCIVPPTEQLVIRPYIVPLLPTFHGMESENPYAHIKEFEDDKAKIWLNSLRPRSIRTWTDLQAEFLKNFPTHRINGLKRQISNFLAKENEKFYECWERYMEAINACPHHGFDTCYWWDVHLNEDVDMKAKFAAMTRRLEELELKKMHEVQAVAETPVQVKPCPICQSYEHLVEECPTIPVLEEPSKFFMEAKSTSYQQPAQPSQQASSLEQAIVNLSKCKRRVDFLLNLTKTPRVSMKWKLMRENLHSKCIIQCKSPLKYKDPGCPTISVMIGGKVVEKALLDLGASVNLLPYSVYKQLGLANHSEEEEGPKRLERREEILPLFNKEEAKKLLRRDPKLNLKPLPMILKRCKKAIGWQISDLKGISPLPLGESYSSGTKEVRDYCGSNEKEKKLLHASLQVGGSGEDHFHMSIWNICLQKNAFWFMQCTCNIPKMYASIFSDMVERIMEVFMDDITIYGGTFEECLVNLEAVLNRCIEKDLVLNWEKCHFMVHQGIVLGHIISEKGIEVDKAKVELIVKLPSPTTVKGVRQFLGHAGFYRSL